MAEAGCCAPFASFTGIARNADIVIRTTSSVCKPSKYEYFGSCRSAWVNSASPSSADIPVSRGPPNVDIFASTRKRISSTGWIFCLAGFFRCGRLAAGFFFGDLRFCDMGRCRFCFSARRTTTAPIVGVLKDPKLRQALFQAGSKSLLTAKSIFAGLGRSLECTPQRRCGGMVDATDLKSVGL